MTGEAEVERLLAELLDDAASNALDDAASNALDDEASNALDDDPRLAALRTAIALEDVFGIVLTDDELDPAVLGDPAAVRRLVFRRRAAR